MAQRRGGAGGGSERIVRGGERGFRGECGGDGGGFGAGSGGAECGGGGGGSSAGALCQARAIVAARASGPAAGPRRALAGALRLCRVEAVRRQGRDRGGGRGHCRDRADRGAVLRRGGRQFRREGRDGDAGRAGQEAALAGGGAGEPVAPGVAQPIGRGEPAIRA